MTLNLSATPGWENVQSFTPILTFLRLFVFTSGARTGQTNGQTDERAKLIMRPIETAAR